MGSRDKPCWVLDMASSDVRCKFAQTESLATESVLLEDTLSGFNFDEAGGISESHRREL